MERRGRPSVVGHPTMMRQVGRQWSIRSVELADVNRERAIVIRGDERAYLVLTIEVEGQRVRTVRIVANPEKLARV